MSKVTHFRREAAVKVGRLRLCPRRTPGGRERSAQPSVHDGRVGGRVVGGGGGGGRAGGHPGGGARGGLRRQRGGGGGVRRLAAARGRVAVAVVAGRGRGHGGRCRRGAVLAAGLRIVSPLWEQW